ncbi:hypothetical protein NDU88_002304 [Pleurodeles waltl]|uniref:Uncharacterized protein n=1 Tax=Pleurodeles waltl TaxID=8319 RepID=A0AAV7TK54_PLEWA|nr:hypothetical protein NDU88_002304 [Pleurodeles waltl]
MPNSGHGTLSPDTISANTIYLASRHRRRRTSQKILDASAQGNLSAPRYEGTVSRCGPGEGRDGKYLFFHPAPLQPPTPTAPLVQVITRRWRASCAVVPGGAGLGLSFARCGKRISSRTQPGCVSSSAPRILLPAASPVHSALVRVSVPFPSRDPPPPARGAASGPLRCGSLRPALINSTRSDWEAGRVRHGQGIATGGSEGNTRSRSFSPGEGQLVLEESRSTGHFEYQSPKDSSRTSGTEARGIPEPGEGSGARAGARRERASKEFI